MTDTRPNNGKCVLRSVNFEPEGLRAIDGLRGRFNATRGTLMRAAVQMFLRAVRRDPAAAKAFVERARRGSALEKTDEGTVG